MRDFYLLFCIVSLFSGISSISISTFIYSSLRKKALKFFIFLNLSFFAIQNCITLELYSKYVPEVSSFIFMLSNFLDLFGTSFCTLSGLFFIHYLFGLNTTKLKKNIFFSVFAFQFISIALYNIFSIPDIFKFIIQASIVAAVIYDIYMVIQNYRYVTDKNLKSTIKFFLIITVLFLPFITLEYYRPYVQSIKNIDFIKILSLPLYFLTLNIFAVVLVLKYFNKPSFMNNNKLTDYFKQKYDITEKQSEIIELIVEGLTYKQIAEKLLISPKTVDNHIQNIYKKLNVNSKIQLSNLVKSNS